MSVCNNANRLKISSLTSTLLPVCIILQNLLSQRLPQILSHHVIKRARLKPEKWQLIDVQETLLHENTTVHWSDLGLLLFSQKHDRHRKNLENRLARWVSFLPSLLPTKVSSSSFSSELYTGYHPILGKHCTHLGSSTSE